MNSTGLSMPAVEPFRQGDDFGGWLRGVEGYLCAVGIQEADRKCAVLLHLVGPDVADLSETLPEETSETADSFEWLKRKLTTYLSPVRTAVAERSLFHGMQMEPEEDLERFLGRLRAQVVRCGYAATEVDRELRDRCVLGSRAGLRAKLVKLAASKGDGLTLAEVRQTARAHRDMEQLGAQLGGTRLAEAPAADAEGAVNVVRSPQSRLGTCFRCGAAGHWQRNCPAAGAVPRARDSRCPAGQAASGGRSGAAGEHGRGAPGNSGSDGGPRQRRCFKCGSTGHLKAACPQRRVRLVAAEEEQTNGDGDAWLVSSVDGDAWLVNSVEASAAEPEMKTVTVNGQQLTMVVDTGSPVSLVSAETARQRGLLQQLDPCDLRLTSFTAGAEMLVDVGTTAGAGMLVDVGTLVDAVMLVDDRMTAGAGMLVDDRMTAGAGMLVDDGMTAGAGTLVRVGALVSAETLVDAGALAKPAGAGTAARARGAETLAGAGRPLDAGALAEAAGDAVMAGVRALREPEAARVTSGSEVALVTTKESAAPGVKSFATAAAPGAECVGTAAAPGSESVGTAVALDGTTQHSEAARSGNGRQPATEGERSESVRKCGPGATEGHRKETSRRKTEGPERPSRRTSTVASRQTTEETELSSRQTAAETEEPTEETGRRTTEEPVPSCQQTEAEVSRQTTGESDGPSGRTAVEASRRLTNDGGAGAVRPTADGRGELAGGGGAGTGEPAGGGGATAGEPDLNGLASEAEAGPTGRAGSPRRRAQPGTPRCSTRRGGAHSRKCLCDGV
ncbi:hypothetical protein FJT64_011438 [Amphibalanus amphitrite]|uniref:CCHC-type domain-containing protein n=1 Tax=Amphibalanus amphitrite TaxID=1232801 RepID=A0A6A4VGC8_AMPAM|nr:hypothetical protein FJT64_011438 [Amphibalanus amphitrite]